MTAEEVQQWPPPPAFFSCTSVIKAQIPQYMKRSLSIHPGFSELCTNRSRKHMYSCFTCSLVGRGQGGVATTVLRSKIHWNEMYFTVQIVPWKLQTFNVEFQNSYIRQILLIYLYHLGGKKSQPSSQNPLGICIFNKFSQMILMQVICGP
jgi:hypothetical protein